MANTMSGQRIRALDADQPNQVGLAFGVKPLHAQ
jgi:hypothetical protein